MDMNLFASKIFGIYAQANMCLNRLFSHRIMNYERRDTLLQRKITCVVEKYTQTIFLETDTQNV